MILVGEAIVVPLVIVALSLGQEGSLRLPRCNQREMLTSLDAVAGGIS